MTLTLDLPLELQQYLLQEADQHGISVEALALQLLNSSISLKHKQAEAANFPNFGQIRGSVLRAKKLKALPKEEK